MEGIFEITRQQLSALGCEEFAGTCAVYTTSRADRVLASSSATTTHDRKGWCEPSPLPQSHAAIRGKPLRRPPRPPKALKQANQALEEAKFALVVRSAMLVLLLNVREKEKRESAVPRVQNEAFGVQAKYFDRLLAGAMLAAEQMYDAKLAVLQANWTAPMDEVAEEKQQLAAEKQRGQAAATECLAFLLGALVSLVVFFFICCSVFFFLRFCYLVRLS